MRWLQIRVSQFVFPRWRGELGVKKRHEGNIERSICEVEGEDLARPAITAPHEDSGAIGEAIEGGHPIGTVVIASNGHNGDARLVESGEGLAPEDHGLLRRNRAVVEIARHDKQLNLLRDGNLEEPVAELRLHVVQGDRAKAAAQMPVGGVEDLHRRRRS